MNIKCSLLVLVVFQQIAAEEAPQKSSFVGIPTLRMPEGRMMAPVVGAYVAKMSLARERNPSILWLRKPAQTGDLHLQLSKAEEAQDFSSYRFELPEREIFPKLYYVHLELEKRLEEETDIFAKRWKLSRRTDLLLPLGKWDNPGRRERFFCGIGLAFHY